MKQNKSIIGINPVTGESIEVTFMGKNSPKNLVETMFAPEVNVGKLIDICINGYCTLKINNNDIVTKELIYSNKKSIVTGDKIFIDKSCKSIPISAQYNISKYALENQNRTENVHDMARITVHDEINNQLKVALHRNDGTAGILTLNNANEIIKDFA